MKKENLIYLKFDYEEAIQSKKDILYVEKSLMTSTIRMKAYLSLRIEELGKRLNLHRKAKELIVNIKKIQKNIPYVKFSKESEDEKEDIKKPELKKEKYSDNIGYQLQEIQKKLNALEQ